MPAGNLTIDAFYPIQYQTNLDLALQQMDSRLQNAVTRADFIGKKKAFNLYNSREAVAISSRLQSTPTNELSGGKYWLTQSPYEVTETFDENNDFFLSQITLPTSEAVMNFAASFNRTMDNVVISALGGTRYIGEDGTTSDALPSGQKVAIDYVESGSAVNSGLTIGKLRQASYVLDVNNVPMDERYIVIAAAQKRDLLRAGEIGDADYNTVRALVNAEIDTFMGFKFIHTNLLPTAGGGTTQAVYAFHKSGLKLSVGKRESYMDIRPDLRHALTVRSVMNLGAVRTENEKVVEITCSI